MKHIMVGFDGSPESRAAVTFATGLAEETGARLTLAGVSYLGDPLASPEWLARMQDFMEEERARTAKRLKELASELARPKLTVDTVVESGAPAPALAELAARLDVDLVVVGHRGRGALKRALLGSVADRLVQICPKPVTVVR
jgi:nucleotide-binding universal stress UspA family protein